MDGIRTPLKSREYTAILSLVGSMDALTHAIKGVDRGQGEQLKKALEIGGAALRAICDTVPLNKLRLIQQDMRHTRIYTKVEAPGISTVDTEHHRYVAAKTLNELVNYVSQAECYLCDKGETEGRKCPIREMMENAIPHELDFKPIDGRCKWAGVALNIGDWEEIG